jgi:type IV pilus assembly protein PilM
MSRFSQGTGAQGGRGLLASLLASSAPDAAIEIAAEGVSVAVLGTRGSDAAVRAFGMAPLPAGAVVPSLAAANIADRAAVSSAIRAACEQAGEHPRRVALVIPDLAARVSLVRFDQVPARRDDLDQLIRWQIKKASPFPAEDACITHSPGVRTAAGAEFIVVAARRETVREYELACEEAGLYAGLVDLATLSIVNLYLAAGEAPGGDWLLVHLRPDYTSLAIMRGEELIFFRNRAEHDAEALSDVVHQTAMYYQDRLSGSGFARVLAGGTSRVPGGVDAARRDLEARLGVPVEPLERQAALLRDRTLSASAAPLPLASVAGMLLRTRREAARA